MQIFEWCHELCPTRSEGRLTFGRSWQVIGAIAERRDIPFHGNAACKLPCKNITLVEEENKFDLRRVARKSR
jgi:hypothetical protein